MNQETKQLTAQQQSEEKKYCQAGRDGECDHYDKCPQKRDNEPDATGRSCPLAWWEDEEL